MNDVDFGTWAALEFGSAHLGDVRRNRRLIAVAAGAAEQPAGKVTQVFREGAKREAAFRLIENDAVEPTEVAAAAHRACAARAAAFDFAFVPVDGTSLKFTDALGSKGLGTVGTRAIGARGLQVMSALAVSPDGVPLGLCGQVYWVRKKPTNHRRGEADSRPLHKKETRHWLTVMGQVRSAFATLAPKTTPWFQLDRGGDAWPVLLEGLEPGQLFTVRASNDRRLWGAGAGDAAHLWDAVTSSKALGHYELDVQAGPSRRARVALMEVRATEVTLSLEQKPSLKLCPATLFALQAREISQVPARERPIEWMLLTTYEVHTLADAQTVLRGYAQRWRIEEFHRIWKTGRCNVEQSQLGGRDHLVRWATILGSVALRILRLTYLGRHQPALPATVEFEREEIDAVVMLRKPSGHRRGAAPTIGKMIEWIAELGGYTGKGSGGPPGAIVIGRGLERIQSVVDVLKSGEM